MSSEALLSGILITVLGWSLTYYLAFFFRKRRLEFALLADIKKHLANAPHVARYFEKYFSENVVAGAPVEYADHYTPDNYTLFNSLQPDLVAHLSKHKLVKVLMFYSELRRLEDWISGLIKDLRSHADDGNVLSESDLARLQRKQQRIVTLIGSLERVRVTASLNSLPLSLDDVPSPESLLPCSEKP